MLADELPAGSADRAARRGVVGAGGPRRVALAELQRAAAGTVSKIDREARVLAKQAASDQANVEDAEARIVQLQSRRDDLRAAQEALTQRTDVSKRVATLTAERDRQALIRADTDTRSATAEVEMSKALADVSECERAVQANQAEITKLQELLSLHYSRRSRFDRQRA